MLTFEERVLCGNPLQQFGSGLEPDPEPTREFGPVANTTPIPSHLSLSFSSSTLLSPKNTKLSHRSHSLYAMIRS